MQYLVFKLNNELYGVNTDTVLNISDKLKVSDVPMAQDYVVGMVNQRDTMKLLLDTNKLLNEPKGDHEQKRIIFLNKINDEEFGLLVDDVLEILNIEENEVQKIDGHIKYYVDGVFKSSNNMVIVIDFVKIIEKIRNEG